MTVQTLTEELRDQLIDTSALWKIIIIVIVIVIIMLIIENLRQFIF